MKKLEQVANEHLIWSLQTFADSDLLATLRKAKQELHELVTAIEMGECKDHQKEELIDVLGCLLSGGAKMGMTLYDMADMLDFKLEKNKKRKWIKTSEGNYQHAPEDWEREEKERNS